MACVPPPARTWSINNFLKSVAFSELAASAVSSGCAVCVMELSPFGFTSVYGLAPPHSGRRASAAPRFGSFGRPRAPFAPKTSYLLAYSNPKQFTQKMLQNRRVSAATIRANQLRLYLSAAAYVLLSAFRRLALSGTAWARVQCETIRSQLLRIGAQLRITARKVWISIASSYPHWPVFAQAHQQ